MNNLVYMLLLLLLICAALPHSDVTPLWQAELTHNRPDKLQQVKEKKGEIIPPPVPFLRSKYCTLSVSDEAILDILTHNDFLLSNNYIGPFSYMSR